MKKIFKKRNYILAGVAGAVVIVAVIVLACRQVARSNEVKSSIEMGDRYLSEMDYEQAVVAYEAAIDIDPKNVEANLGLAEAYEGRQMYAYAEAVYQNMLENDDTQAEIYEKLASLYMQQNKLEEAKEVLQQAVERLESEELTMLYEVTRPEPPGTSYDAGAYEERIKVELLPAQAGDTIYYTLDGTVPDTGSKIYDEPIILKNGVTAVKAMVVNTAGYQSDIASYEYDIRIRTVEVTLEEPVIEQVVREALDIPYEEPIHNDDIEQVTQLYLVGEGLRTIRDEHSVYLEETQYSVDGYVNGIYGQGVISSLDDLRYMPFLEKVAIEYQPELDISALAECAGVKELSLVGDHLSSRDIGALRGMTQLVKLNLGWNEIDDISALAGLTELTSLGVWGNNIRNIQPAAGLKELIYFDFSDNQVADISPLAELTKIRQLWMYRNQVTDISAIANLGELHVLMLRDNPVENPEAARSIYPHLTRLDVDLLNLGAEQ